MQLLLIYNGYSLRWRVNATSVWLHGTLRTKSILKELKINCPLPLRPHNGKKKPSPFRFNSILNRLEIQRFCTLNYLFAILFCVVYTNFISSTTVTNSTAIVLLFTACLFKSINLCLHKFSHVLRIVCRWLDTPQLKYTKLVTEHTIQTPPINLQVVQYIHAHTANIFIGLKNLRKRIWYCGVSYLRSIFFLPLLSLSLCLFRLFFFLCRF